MNLLSLDLELNQLNGKPKIIQVGAAIFHVNTGKMVDSLELFVDPGEPITQFITDLTGIVDRDVVGAPNVTEAYYLLKAFAKKRRVAKMPIVWGSGTRNDSSSLHEEAKVEEQNFMGFRVLDAKTLYQSWAIVNDKTPKAGLKTACENLGIEFEGTVHTALTDAINTFKVWKHLSFMIKPNPTPSTE